MVGMVPWAAILTGLASGFLGGILGAGGAYIGATATARAQNKRARHADKRQVYHDVLASCENLTKALRAYSATDPQTKSALDAANFALFLALLDLRLIAPENVVSSADDVDKYFKRWIADPTAGKFPSPEPQEYVTKRTALLNAMRDDLS
jgi:hypothetical protein